MGDLQQHTAYDGFGKLVNEYNSGANRDEAHTIAATQFITIIPMAPLSSNEFPNLDLQYWYPELLDKVVDQVIAKYPVDTNRFHCAGYSMGGFGSWRFAVHRPDLPASLTVSGANAEFNSITNSRGETIPPISDQLDKIAHLPVRAFSGSSDTTIYPDLAEKTQGIMRSLGDSKSEWQLLGTYVLSDASQFRVYATDYTVYLAIIPAYQCFLSLPISSNGYSNKNALAHQAAQTQTTPPLQLRPNHPNQRKASHLQRTTNLRRTTNPRNA